MKTVFDINAIHQRLTTLSEAFAMEKSTASAMQAWFHERCVLHPQYVTSFADLFADWQQWAIRNQRYKSSRKRLSMALVYLGLERRVLCSGCIRAYLGIALKRPIVTEAPTNEGHGMDVSHPVLSTKQAEKKDHDF